MIRPAATICVVLAAASCGGADAPSQIQTMYGVQAAPVVTAMRRADGTIIDDRSLCTYPGRTDIEVNETAGPGSIQPNVRRVWKLIGEGIDRRKVLICREIDTNLDGFKDVVRHYNDDGQSKDEQADTDFDGRVDTWIYFGKGRLAEARLDHNADGLPDEWKYYSEGKLVRVKRDSDFDTRADVWEMYRDGRLERMGVDLDGNERVDRWDHDTAWRRALDAKEREQEREAAKKKEDETAAARDKAMDDMEKGQKGKSSPEKPDEAKDKAGAEKPDEAKDKAGAKKPDEKKKDGKKKGGAPRRPVGGWRQTYTRRRAGGSACRG
ncbi:MAG: hypothetical protein HY744_00230 [Deltaproteobacteria bacterium]|nr:hypothetical protein [Deltaproteobacteria bacterium]